MKDNQITSCTLCLNFPFIFGVHSFIQIVVLFVYWQQISLITYLWTWITTKTKHGLLLILQPWISINFSVPRTPPLLRFPPFLTPFFHHHLYAWRRYIPFVTNALFSFILFYLLHWLYAWVLLEIFVQSTFFILPILYRLVKHIIWFLKKNIIWLFDM